MNNYKNKLNDSEITLFMDSEYCNNDYNCTLKAKNGPRTE
jgi:hypothetical protein